MIPAAAELAEVIAAAAPSVTVYDHVPVTPVAPSIWVAWADFVNFEKGGTLAGHRPADLAVTFCVGLADGRSAQVAMGELIYGTVPAALEEHEPTTYRHLVLKNISNTRVTEDRHLLTDLNLQILY